jgi:hypothetical protein
LIRLFAVLFFLVCLATPAWGRDDIEQQKIAYLITSVETLEDATFVRNGESYDAEQAADHLRVKLRYAGNRVRTAADFIAICATESSISGIKYEIRFRDGRTVDSATFLHGKLTEYEARAASGTR